MVRGDGNSEPIMQPGKGFGGPPVKSAHHMHERRNQQHAHQRRVDQAAVATPWHPPLGKRIAKMFSTVIESPGGKVEVPECTHRETDYARDISASETEARSITRLYVVTVAIPDGMRSVNALRLNASLPHLLSAAGAGPDGPPRAGSTVSVWP